MKKITTFMLVLIMIISTTPVTINAVTAVPTINTFTASWTGETESVVDFEKTRQLSMSWNIQNAIKLEPGELKLVLPKELVIEAESSTKARINIPAPEAIIGDDGNIDYTVDYGDARFVYRVSEDNPNEVVISNLHQIDETSTGDASVSYEWSGEPFTLHKESFEINGIIPKLIVSSDGETVESQGTELGLKYTKEKEVKARITKDAEWQGDIEDYTGPIYKTWQDKWGDDVKPANPEDYIYVEYRYNATATNINRQYIMSIVDEKLDKVDPFAYTSSFRVKNRTTGSYFYTKYGNSKYKLLTDYEPINLDATLSDKYKDIYDGTDMNPKTLFNEYEVQYMGKILARVSKSELVAGETYDFKNKIKLVLTPEYEGEVVEAEDTEYGGRLIYTQKDKVEYTEPADDSYLLDIRRQYTEPEKSIESLDSDFEITYRYSRDYRELVHKLSYDSKYGDVNNKEAYNKKSHKIELIMNNPVMDNNELSINDYYTKSTGIRIDKYLYTQEDETSDYRYIKDEKGELNNIVLYARNIASGEYEKVAEFNIDLSKYSKMKDVQVYNDVTYSYNNFTYPKNKYANTKIVMDSNESGINIHADDYIAIKNEDTVRNKLIANDIQSGKKVSVVLHGVTSVKVTQDGVTKTLSSKGDSVYTSVVEKESGEKLLYDEDYNKVKVKLLERENKS